MMESLNRIKTFSECPRRYTLRYTDSSTTKNIRIVESIIKEAYLQMTETGFKMDWRKLLSLVDSKIFSDIDIANTIQLEKSKLEAEYILSSLSKWYNDIYLESNIEVFVNIFMKTAINRQTVCGTIPIVQLSGECPIITTVSSNDTNTVKLFNNFVVRGMAWLVQKELECDAIKCTNLGIGTKGSLDVVSIYIAKEDYLRTEDLIFQLVGLMASGVDYPSFSERCNNCEYNKKCKI